MADDDLQAQLEARRAWFLECQLRRLNMGAFAGLRAETTASDEKLLLKLISEHLGDDQPRYLDDHEPVWTTEERTRRNKFAQTLIGRNCNWLEYQEPELVVATLARIADEFANDRYSSVMEASTPRAPLPGFVSLLNSFRRKAAPTDANQKGQAISRATIAEAKPWLIPELYGLAHPGADGIKEWLDNLVEFIADFERELNISTGGAAADAAPFDPADTASYREWILTRMQRELQREADSASGQLRDSSDAVKVQFVEQVDDKYAFNIRVETNGAAPVGRAGAPLASEYPPSRRTRYWAGVVNDAIKEVYVNKPDSDMGTCTLIRMLYLFGTIPQHVASGENLRRWRRRTAPPPRGGIDEFNTFFAHRAADGYFAGDGAEEARERQRLSDAEAKLRIILETSALLPNTASVAFSPVVNEILRKGLHHYKFWLDEPLRAMNNSALQKARTDLGYGGKDGGDAPTEMEYWSENHYIMFASSEYLVGQLWEADEFQPGKAFLGNDKTGILSGSQRKERGKARVLKWLHHRLMFGWAEFNSSGYLREHLWALLNLVDFAQDPEVRDKAAVATDLLLFDIARFQHRGAMGAAGGRSQFKSKACGWDNGPGDAVEILFGTRGMFGDEDSQLGASVATTSYRAPQVLLEIGTRDKPRSDAELRPVIPNPPLVDRSRVSITFDDAYRYGIWFSQESDEVTSRRNGYAPKLARHFPFIKSVNDTIDSTHTQYGPYEDSIVFWWTTSSFINKQVVKKSLEYVERYGLDKTGVWAKLADLINHYVPLAKGAGLGGFAYGALNGVVVAVGGLGPVSGILEFLTSDDEDYVEEFAALLEGSSRTRANIATYSNGDAMLSCIQNFRPGQLNYQSNVSQVTMNRAVNVFSTAGFAGADLSPVTVGAAGAVVGGALGAIGGMAGLGAAVGALGAIIGESAAIEGTNIFGDATDGPDWWTGYLALPMVVQHRGAAILAYQFPELQSNLAETQSHVWFPKKGFDTTAEQRSSAYDDDNSFFEEPFDLSKNGHWLFGRIVHPQNGTQAADWPEAYVGVFSNKRPDWLNVNEDADLYGTRFEAAVDEARDRINELEDKIEDSADPDEKTKMQNEIGDLKRTWLDFADESFFGHWTLRNDYFADKDWNVEGDNVWVIQVGSKAEFGDFEQFKDRVSRAKVVIDDTGDLECTYHMPLPLSEGGGSAALTLEYGDGGVFKLDGAPLETDLYPRFENAFIRGGRVEWGQRSYVIEANGKVLLHDFHDFAHPHRTEDIAEIAAAEPDSVRALVLYATTGEEEMEEFTIGTATVQLGCVTVADDEIIAVGPVGENTRHDAEWIFFDKPHPLTPDLTLELAHRPTGDGDDDSEWDLSFSIRALMGDHRLVDCVLSTSRVPFSEDLRRCGPLPLAVKTERWRPWAAVPDSRVTGAVVLVGRHPWFNFYYNHCDLLMVTPARPVRHRRVHACLNAAAVWSEIPSEPTGPAFDATTTVRAFSRFPGNVEAFAVLKNRLYVSSVGADLRWSIWREGAEDVTGFPPHAVPFAVPGSLHVAASVLSVEGAEIIATGSDGHLYANFAWQPDAVTLWRKLKVSGFDLRTDGDCVLAGDRLFVLAKDGALWSAVIDRQPLFPMDPDWVKLSPDGADVANFTVVDASRLLVVTSTGELRDVTLSPGPAPRWDPLPTPTGQPVPAQVRVAWATPEFNAEDVGLQFLSMATTPDRLVAFVTVGGTVYTQTWTETGWQGWAPVVPGGQGFAAADRTPLVIQRLNGQLELLVQTAEGDLIRTWWS